MSQQLDAVVLGVGSSGTIGGLAAFFKKHAPHVELVLADPQGSILAEYIATGKMTQKGSWLVEGIGEDFIPTICDFSLTKRAYSIPRCRIVLRRRASCCRRKAILAGSSTGTLLAGGAALLPRAEDAEARGHVRVRHRRALPVEALQRFLDGGPGLHRARAATAICAT